MSTTPRDARAIATARTPGFDVARALAVLGMVTVNYSSFLGASHRGPGWLIWGGERLEGRSAALFVLLAGVGISLRSRRAREDPAAHRRFERLALVKRAGILFFAGVLNLHLWRWDILHFYGVFLLLSAVFLTARASVLWGGVAAFSAGSVALHLRFDYGTKIDVWTPLGGLSDLFFNGLHPVFPWMSFLLVGMWLGRLDLRRSSTRTPVVVVALLVLLAGEGLGLLAIYREGVAPEWLVSPVGSWPRPPTPSFLLAAGGTAVALVCLCVAVTESRPAARWVVALTATGQLAFTLYIAHAIAIVVPLQHGLLEHASLAVAMAYAACFYTGSIAFSLWWRRRWAQGPLEALIRQVTGRAGPAPWGGALLSSSNR